MTQDQGACTELVDDALLERIDQIFACGASKHVEIPQIVAIGDQSAGKSSVLSSLMGKDLPRDSRLCTRYPTKLIFRRSPETNISISVQPDPKASNEHRKLVETIQTWKRTSFEETDLEEIIKSVNEKIFPEDDSDPSKPRAIFSNDVLQIEVSGPNEKHFSIVDVPGIFRDPEHGSATHADMEFVRSMVEGYMKNPRSVMLAVVPVDGDIANQEIMELAKKVDPAGDRTLGVLTKPDRRAKETEQQIIDLLNGTKGRKLKLGWHVVCNVSQDRLADKTIDKRGYERRFFTHMAPWNTLAVALWGIDSLRIRLRAVLGKLVQRDFIHVMNDIKMELEATQRKLSELGPERNSPASQSAYLIRLASEFQDLVRDALSCNFGNEIFQNHPELMIAPLVMNRMDVFERDMAWRGHTYKLSEPESDSCLDPNSPSANDSSSTRLEADILELADILEPAVKTPVQLESDPKAWLRDLYSRHRGFEIGTFSPALLTCAMKEQTQKWPSISLGYTSDVIVIIHRFLMQALEVLCKNERLQSRLYESLKGDLKARYVRAKEQANFIRQVELNGLPMTMSNHFSAKLQKQRHGRMVTLCDSAYNDRNVHSRQPQIPCLNNKEYTLQDVGDILLSYYQVARKRFVDNVVLQATDYFLVHGPESPLTVFSPISVGDMKPEQLEKIAGEEEQTKKQRENLKKKIAELEKIKSILAN